MPPQMCRRPAPSSATLLVMRYRIFMLIALLGLTLAPADGRADEPVSAAETDRADSATGEGPTPSATDEDDDRADSDESEDDVDVAETDDSSDDTEPAPLPKGLGPQVLGESLDAVDALLPESPDMSDTPWVRFGDRVMVRFEDDRAVELQLIVPSGPTTCREAAVWLGYTDASHPLRKRDRCLWPGISDRHRLGDGVSGTLYLQSRQFGVKVR